jgi:TRAP-type C4-dicarboxylate transport system permease small subunit
MESTQTHAPPQSVEAVAHSFEEADRHVVDLSPYREEDWITFLLFWIMCALVFTQFFTRYVLNDSYAWTEELATYSLIGVVFIGASMCVRQNRHIHVDFLYRYLPHRAARVLSTVVDLARVVLLGYVSFLVLQYVQMVGPEPMTTIDWPKRIVYSVAFAGFALMTFRAALIARDNWRQGFSILERPQAYDGTETGV